MPGVPCLTNDGNGNPVFLPGYFHFRREITKGKMERRINNKKQNGGGEKSFLMMPLPLPLSLSDSSPVPYCAKPHTRRASSDESAQRHVDWNIHQRHGGGVWSCIDEQIRDKSLLGWFSPWRRSKRNKTVCELGRKDVSSFWITFTLATGSVQLHPLSDKAAHT